MQAVIHVVLLALLARNYVGKADTDVSDDGYVDLASVREEIKLNLALNRSGFLSPMCHCLA